MDVLVDMNLSPRWVEFLEAGGYEVIHWTTVGDADAPDRALMQWAEERGCVVLTHDLDFAALLASTLESGPSIIQIRTDDVLPTRELSGLILRALRQFESELEEGAILSIDVDRFRVRHLPLDA